MRCSVCIPTHRRPEALARCLRALAPQARAGVEVLVGIDGPDTGEADAARAALPAARVIPCPKAGPASTRNALLAHATAPLLLWLNDDVVPAPDVVAQHLAAHADLPAPAMVLGSAPFAVTPPDRLFDRLVRETSMVFFYDQMDDTDPARDWGYRHAWTLNLSMPSEPLRAIGGFTTALGAPAYEDLECAFRLARAHAMPVLYRPGARVVHEHRYEPEGYLARERSLGREALALAHAAPECALDLFRRDLREPREVDAARALVERLGRDAQRCQREFLELAHIPADSLTGPHAARLVRLLYQQHLLLKRVRWHEGYLDAAAGGRSAVA